MTKVLRIHKLFSYIRFIAADFKFGMKIAQMVFVFVIFLNIICCIWIKIFALKEEVNFDEEYGLSSYPNILPGKLKVTLEDYYENGDMFRYNTMLFMTLFNVMGHDIAPNTVSTFWVSFLLMFTGFLIIVNLIGEFTNIINDIYESDTNNEIDENLHVVE